jgi:hypothetical protein
MLVIISSLFIRNLIFKWVSGSLLLLFEFLLLLLFVFQFFLFQFFLLQLELLLIRECIDFYVDEDSLLM